MKTIGNLIIGLLLVCLTIGTLFWMAGNQKTITEEEFFNFKDEVRERFQRAESKLDTLQSSVDRIERNMDTLKNGQEVIFDQVKKQSGTSFWDFLK